MHGWETRQSQTLGEWWGQPREDPEGEQSSENQVPEEKPPPDEGGVLGNDANETLMMSSKVFSPQGFVKEPGEHHNAGA